MHDPDFRKKNVKGQAEACPFTFEALYRTTIVSGTLCTTFAVVLSCGLVKTFAVPVTITVYVPGHSAPDALGVPPVLLLIVSSYCCPGPEATVAPQPVKPKATTKSASEPINVCHLRRRPGRPKSRTQASAAPPSAIQKRRGVLGAVTAPIFVPAAALHV